MQLDATMSRRTIFDGLVISLENYHFKKRENFLTVRALPSPNQAQCSGHNQIQFSAQRDTSFNYLEGNNFDLVPTISPSFAQIRFLFACALGF